MDHSDLADLAALADEVPTLRGALAPVDRECVITDALEIKSDIPADLTGPYVRTGPLPPLCRTKPPPLV